MSVVEIVAWREPAWKTADLTGYEVEATDGKIGKIDDMTTEVQSRGFVVVDTGPWILGKKALLPAGILQSVDHDAQKVYVDRSKDEIKSAPEFDDSTFGTEPYQTRIGNYYSRTGATIR
jgi:hypothetical protein